MKRMLAGAFVAALPLATLLCRDVAAASCESLAPLALPQARITSAVAVPAGDISLAAAAPGAAPVRVRGLPAFCRVAATLTPSSDSDIKIEVWLPESGWNRKFQAVGNGGWAGTISYAAMGDALRRGYATASTDTGHAGASASFALGHPEKLLDYTYRSEHEMTVKAKAVTSAFYGSAPTLSYWTGCSNGGKQGLKEAQQYPDDFDGIVAGAPALNWSGRSAQSIWINQAVHGDEASSIPAAAFALIHRAVLDACDARDGVTDGVLENPRACPFDPKALLCKAGGEAACLTAPQVEAVRKIYSNVVNPRTGATIFPGHERGSELGWSTMAGPQPFAIGLEFFRFAVFQDPNWVPARMDFDAGYARAEQAANGTIDAKDPNLGAYFSRGGKLIQYHGWSDPQISPGSSVDYYQSVVSALGGADKIDASYRLFMVPGMAHCRGGDGPDSFDMLTALEQWVEHRQAPSRVIASRARNGAVDRTRPLCPYPQVARYKGTGSTDAAGNFICAGM